LGFIGFTSYLYSHLFLFGEKKKVREKEKLKKNKEKYSEAILPEQSSFAPLFFQERGQIFISSAVVE
jgi:hypothetical protein